MVTPGSYDIRTIEKDYSQAVPVVHLYHILMKIIPIVKLSICLSFVRKIGDGHKLTKRRSHQLFFLTKLY